MRRLVRMISFVALLAFAIPATLALAGEADPVNGTWELDLAKSKFSGTAPKSQTRTYLVEGDSLKLTSEGIDADGKPTRTDYNAHYDGQDYPIMGVPNADTISLKRTDLYTSVATLKKGGKVTITSTRTASKDGKTLTIRSQGTNASGEKVDNTMVFTKR